MSHGIAKKAHQIICIYIYIYIHIYIYVKKSQAHPWLCRDSLLAFKDHVPDVSPRVQMVTFRNKMLGKTPIDFPLRPESRDIIGFLNGTTWDILCQQVYPPKNGSSPPKMWNQLTQLGSCIYPGVCPKMVDRMDSTNSTDSVTWT
jgi:hypothetical protein